MSAENVEIVRAIYRAFASGDVPGVLSRLSPKVEWWEAENFIYADGNPYIGPQSVLEGVFLRFVSNWNDFTATPEAILDAGDRIVTLGIYAGKFKATGKTVRAQMVHVFTIENEKVVKFQQYTDTKQFADAVQ
jgi:ketosteroid isomerase-like protein